MRKNTVFVLVVLAVLVTLVASGNDTSKATGTLYSSIQLPADIKFQKMAAQPLYSSIQPPADIKFQELAAQPLYSSIQPPADLQYQQP